MVWVFVLSWPLPLRTNHHARIVMGLDVAVSAEVLSNIQFNIAAQPGWCPSGGGLYRPARNDPECTGRWAQTVECLGGRPAGTSLLSLGRAATC